MEDTAKCHYVQPVPAAAGKWQCSPVAGCGSPGDTPALLKGSAQAGGRKRVRFSVHLKGGLILFVIFSFLGTLGQNSSNSPWEVDSLMVLEGFEWDQSSPRIFFPPGNFF